MGAGQTDDRHDNITDHAKKDSVFSGSICPFKIFLPKIPGQEGVDADPGARGYSYHQILHRKRKGNRRQGLLIDLCDKHAVNDIVERLYQHRNNHWQGHGD